MTFSDASIASESVGGRYTCSMQEEAWSFLLKLCLNTPVIENQNSFIYFGALTASTLRINERGFIFLFNAATTVLHNLVRAVQPWLACKNGRLFILLSNIPA